MELRDYYNILVDRMDIHEGFWSDRKQCQTLFRGGAPKSLQMVIAAMKLKDTYFLEGKL